MPAPNSWSNIFSYNFSVVTCPISSWNEQKGNQILMKWSTHIHSITLMSSLREKEGSYLTANTRVINFQKAFCDQEIINDKWFVHYLEEIGAKYANYCKNVKIFQMYITLDVPLTNPLEYILPKICTNWSVLRITWLYTSELRCRGRHYCDFGQRMKMYEAKPKEM